MNCPTISHHAETRTCPWDTGSSAITLEDSSKAGHHCETNVLPSNSHDMQVSKSPQASKWNKATITLLMLRTAGQMSYTHLSSLPTISHLTRETNVPWDNGSSQITQVVIIRAGPSLCDQCIYFLQIESQSKRKKSRHNPLVLHSTQDW